MPEITPPSEQAALFLKSSQFSLEILPVWLQQAGLTAADAAPVQQSDVTGKQQGLVWTQQTDTHSVTRSQNLFY